MTFWQFLIGVPLMLFSLGFLAFGLSLVVGALFKDPDTHEWLDRDDIIFRGTLALACFLTFGLIVVLARS